MNFLYSKGNHVRDDTYTHVVIPCDSGYSYILGRLYSCPYYFYQICMHVYIRTGLQVTNNFPTEKLAAYANGF